MHTTSALYKQLLSNPNSRYETRLTIGESGRLMDERGNVITFGGDAILVGGTGPDAGYDENLLRTIKIRSSVFKKTPSVGNTIAAQIEIHMDAPVAEIPKQARLAPFVRLTDGVNYSEWIPKGVFFVDTRPENGDRNDFPDIEIHGFDAMLKAEAPYPPSKLDWPACDIDVVREIADAMQVSLDPRTEELLVHGYMVQYPAEYSQREVLGYIAAMYGANAMMTDLGELWFAGLASIPKESRVLIDENGFAITFGGDRIRV